MKVIDPGHLYSLDHLDGDGQTILRFVKRVGENYPGNTPPPYQGVTIQEVLRAIIERLVYVNNQEGSALNLHNIDSLRAVMRRLEERAAEKRGDKVLLHAALKAHDGHIETAPTCSTCHHIGCSVHRLSENK